LRLPDCLNHSVAKLILRVENQRLERREHKKDSRAHQATQCAELEACSTRWFLQTTPAVQRHTEESRKWQHQDESTAQGKKAEGRNGRPSRGRRTHCRMPVDLISLL
jgi:hypothetical protein